jgi:membrane associated rhomboid family serine protease
VTYAIIATNVVVWLLVQGAGTEPALARSVCELGLIPAEVTSSLEAPVRVPLDSTTICVVGAGQAHPAWITVFSSMFMHGGWAHLLGNVWFLWIFGNNVEDVMGRTRFVAFYLLTGIVAAAAQVLVNAGSVLPMVGASGAISGVMGAYILLFPRVRVHMIVVLFVFVTTISVPAYLMLAYWIVLQIISSVPALTVESGGVAYWAHIGGFFAGLVLVRLFRHRELVAKHRAFIGYRSTWR